MQPRLDYHQQSSAAYQAMLGLERFSRWRSSSSMAGIGSPFHFEHRPAATSRQSARRARIDLTLPCSGTF
jgi:hypothetical protein